MQPNIKIIAGSHSQNLANIISNTLNLECIYPTITTFADSELRIQIQGNFKNAIAVIIQSTSKPVNDSIIELVMLIDTIKHSGARMILAILPYFGYSRQNKMHYYWGPISSELMINIIKTAGAHHILTLDSHFKPPEKKPSINIHNIKTMRLYTSRIQSLSKNFAIISPDHGGAEKAMQISKFLQCPFIQMTKKRIAHNKCTIMNIQGDPKNKDCIIVDDIIDTSETVCKTAKLLKKYGAKKIFAFITHPVLSNNAIHKIEQSAIEKLFISNSIEQKTYSKKIEFIDVKDLLCKAILRIIGKQK